MAAECGVAAVVIVGVQPSGEFVAALGVAGVEPGDAVSVSWRTHWLTSGGIHAALHGLDIS